MRKKLFCLLLFAVIGLQLLQGESESATAEGKILPGKKDTKRALLELGTFMAVSSVNYWIKYTKFIEDWQFKLNWRDQKKRLFSSEGIRLDSNSYKSNWTHALSGALYYNFARTNRLTWLESSLFAFGGSLFWEAISEWREIISINDMIFTPFGGPATGEPLFQIGKYFSAKNGIINHLVGAFFNPVLAINNLLDGKKRNREKESVYPGWHQFEFFIGAQRGEPSADAQRYARTNLGLQLQLVPIPDYGLPGEFSGFLKDPLSTVLDFNISFSAREMEEFSARARTILFGYWQQNLSQSDSGEIKGYSFLLGVGSAFDVFKKKALVTYDSSAGGLSDPRYPRQRPYEFNDKLSTISLLGPAFDLALFSRQFRLRWNADAFFDFALVNSLPLNAYSVEHDLANAKTTVLSWGYYYGFGFSLASATTIDLGRWQWHGAAKYRKYNSVQGLDRFQDVVSDDFKLNDSFLTFKTSIGFRPGWNNTCFRIGVESIRRYGSIGDFSLRNRETRLFGQMSIGF